MTEAGGTTEAGGVTERPREVRRLFRTRPRSLFLRVSAVLFAALIAYAWLSGDLAPADLFSEHSARNVSRFLEKVTPRPLRGRPFDLAVLAEWAAGVLDRGGAEAVGTTLAVAVAAIALAAVGAALLGPLAARTLATPEPWLPGGRAPPPAARLFWRAVVGLTRALFILLRAIPEYVWAFILIVLFGRAAWAAVLALALHNTGILGKLNAESIENLPRGVPAALRGLGASRPAVAAAGILPAAFARFLLYFFHRWETCVREATILGMLNLVALGYWINLAHHARRYDEMVFLVLLGAALVLVGDLVSAAARALIRRAT